MAHVVHRAKERGGGEHGWLSTRFSFSFAHWYDPERMGFGTLRVINDDTIAPDSGFGPHQHDNMEIITLVMEGAVTHEDSMGNRYAVPAGDVQVMSAGTGVTHAEYNRSKDATLKLFQIWILPRERNIVPRYDQKSFGTTWKKNTLELLVSPDGREGSLMIHQDAFVSRGALEEGQSLDYTVRVPQNGLYILVVSGSVEIEGEALSDRDAIGIEKSETVSIQALSDATFLVFEVPKTGWDF